MKVEQGTLLGSLVVKDILIGSLTSKASLCGRISPRSVLVGTISSRVQLVGRLYIPKVKVENSGSSDDSSSDSDTGGSGSVDSVVGSVEYIDSYVLVLKDGTMIPTEVVEIVDISF